MRQKKLVYYGKKCLIFLISVFILSVVVFYVARLAPGDPLISYYGDRTEKMSPEEREGAVSGYHNRKQFPQRFLYPAKR